MTSVERWAPIPGYEGVYEVSDQGRVRSLDRTIAHGGANGGERTIRGRILAQGLTRADRGYLSVGFYDHSRPKVHRLVGYAFLELGHEQDIDHLNGDKQDNRAANLQPVTHAENMLRWSERRTHCKNGHELTDANTVSRGVSRRACRTCVREWDRRKRKKAAA